MIQRRIEAVCDGLDLKLVCKRIGIFPHRLNGGWHPNLFFAVDSEREPMYLQLPGIAARACSPVEGYPFESFEVSLAADLRSRVVR